ncbi:MAG: hypothetical protein EBU92_07015, partial [Betaproteobacteria bacterium]|nr:hypothetical protein [Betaproteobacteria bacterium]
MRIFFGLGATCVQCGGTACECGGACEKRFTTYERAEISLPVVVKKDGCRQEFSANKLRASMQLALRKRPVSTPQVDDAIARIEEQLMALPDGVTLASAAVCDGAHLTVEGIHRNKR